MKEVIFQTNLRTYYLDQVYEEFGGPLLFLASDAVGTKFLVSASYRDDNCGHWVLVSISEKRLLELLDDKLSIYDAFKTSETGLITKLTHDVNTGVESEETIKVEDIPDDCLPSDGFYLTNIIS